MDGNPFEATQSETQMRPPQKPPNAQRPTPTPREVFWANYNPVLLVSTLVCVRDSLRAVAIAARRCRLAPGSAIRMYPKYNNKWHLLLCILFMQ